MKKDMKFEEAIKKLGEINAKLEEESITLEESIKLYKDGIELSKFCQTKLEEAKQVIEEIQ